MSMAWQVFQPVFAFLAAAVILFGIWVVVEGIRQSKEYVE